MIRNFQTPKSLKVREREYRCLCSYYVINTYASLMYELKKIGKIFTSKFAGPRALVLWKNYLPGRGLTKVGKHCLRIYVRLCDCGALQQNLVRELVEEVWHELDRTDRRTERKTGIKIDRAEGNYIRKELIKQLINGEEKAEKTSERVTLKEKLWCEFVGRKRNKRRHRKKTETME
jgi:hypothetical protein